MKWVCAWAMRSPTYPPWMPRSHTTRKRKTAAVTAPALSRFLLGKPSIAAISGGVKNSIQAALVRPFSL